MIKNKQIQWASTKIKLKKILLAILLGNLKRLKQKLNGDVQVAIL